MSSVKKQIVEELHKPARRNYPRRSLVMKGVDDTWEADLVEMQPYATVNKKFRYMLTVIDDLSKFAWAVGVKSKKAEEIAAAFTSIIESSKRKPKNLHTDLGGEFFNSTFAALTALHNINHYRTYSGIKGACVERFNRTLKEKMWKRFSVNGNYKWVDMLPDIMREYNSSVHRTTNMKPEDVNRRNQKKVLDRIKQANREKMQNIPRKKVFKVGDTVRLSKVKTIFEKGYTPNWTTELYTVTKVKPGRPTTYYLRDENDEDVKGCFYREELQKTKFKEDYLVEKVLRTKNDKSYVKWLGFDSSYNSWISNSDIH